jgi:predicted metal-dependent HD superfamily phosphohydrolase
MVIQNPDAIALQQRFIVLVQRLARLLLIKKIDDHLLATTAFELVSAYQQPHRHYHSTVHLQACLNALDAICADAKRAAWIAPAAYAAIEFALFFHDAIYQPQLSNNEQRSADWAAKAIKALLGVQPEFGHLIHQMIMATQHSSAENAENSAETQLLLDIDLSIFGAGQAEFDAYDQGIRAEYHFVPEARYKTARAAILQRFLDAPVLYHTAFFADKTEAARANLRRTLARLVSA